jgi:carnitine-CoA ligase
MSGVPDFTFAELLTRIPAGGAVVTADGTLRAEACSMLAARAAGALTELGVHRGDRLGVMLHNEQAILAAWFGAAWAGVTFVPVNTRLRGDTLRYIVGHFGPRLLIVADDLVAPIASELGPERRVVGSAEWGQRVAHGPEQPMAAPPDLGCIFYTSGTTGRPKGVAWHPVTQARHSWLYARELVPLEAGEGGYTGFPLFHVQSMGVAMSCLLNRATAHIDPRFSVTRFWPRIRETRAAMFAYMGTILALLLKAPPQPDDRDHRLRYAMGAAATPDLWRAFEARFGVPLLECYGQTEMSACWSGNPVGSGRIGSIGPFCDRADTRLEPVAAGSPVALLHIRPRQPHLMMEGYYRDPEATAAVFADGWYNSRDLVRADADGWLYYAGRVTDSVRRRGEHISAYEVERVVAEHPDLLEVAVVGVASELAEQDVALYYVRRPDHAVAPSALADWCRARLSDFMVPRYYREVATFPKTATERIQKGALVDLALLSAFDAEPAAPDGSR